MGASQKVPRQPQHHPQMPPPRQNPPHLQPNYIILPPGQQPPNLGPNNLMLPTPNHSYSRIGPNNQGLLSPTTLHNKLKII